MGCKQQGRLLGGEPCPQHAHFFFRGEQSRGPLSDSERVLDHQELVIKNLFLEFIAQAIQDALAHAAAPCVGEVFFWGGGSTIPLGTIPSVGTCS